MLSKDKIEQQRELLNPEKLRAEAQQETDLSDYGNTYFFQPMNRLMERAVTEVDFSDPGIKAYRDDIIRCLINRLRTEDDIKKHPEILDEDVSDPLIIIGLPRSGTTKMQRMMATDPNVNKLLTWQMWNPARFPTAVDGEPDPRMAAVGIGMGDAAIKGDEAEKAHTLAQAAHNTAMMAVEEEFMLFDFTFDETVIGFNTSIPLLHYQDLGVDKPDKESDRQAYNYVKKLLQYRQWQQGGSHGKPWLLKTVIHHTHLETLMDTFPNATLLHCHRNPLSNIPSLTKMMWAVWSTKSTVDKKYAGEEFLKWTSIGIQRYMHERKRLQLDDRIIDVKYEDVRDNIMPVIEQAYARAGWELTPEGRANMQAWEKENEQGKHGAHSYSPEEFGLSEQMILSAFKEYMQLFI